ncbi:MAG: glycoside hydrolase family 2 [Ignavibacteriales bacterium]|nr:MAG: glycoside hydrolase family 2 [Ignavibacteriales bacterium]
MKILSLIAALFLFQIILQPQNNLSKVNTFLADWSLQSSDSVNANGEIISGLNYKPTGWLKCDIPTTVFNALIKNNFYTDWSIGDNMKRINADKFKTGWWYRKEFTLDKILSGKIVRVAFNGLNYRANIWLNGNKVASSEKMFGAFRRFEFDITKLIKFDKANVLAVEVLPPQPGEPTIGFVDWNPIPPDRNMGLWREVEIKFSDKVSIDFPYVKSKINLKDYSSAALTVTAEVNNHSDQTVKGILSGSIGNVKFNREVELNAGENKLVTFTPEEFEQLNIKNPRLWWTYDLGKAELYDLKLDFKIENIISDSLQTRFGIREVSDYLNANGHKAYKLNGKNILIRGGGWVDDIFLDYDPVKLNAQIEYAKQMNLNTIRLEGFWGNNQDLYNLCDEKGILLMAGWSCQWEWTKLFGKETHKRFGGITSPEDIQLVSTYWNDQIKWFRNHPSIFVWLMASDLVPHPDLEKNYHEILKEIDSTRPFLISAAKRRSDISGLSGVKMNGPYDYVPPSYWYTDTTTGGAYGFNTETSPGPQIPPLESIKKFIPQNHLWPIDSIWFYHCGGNVFGTLERYNDAMDKKLGAPNNIEEYCSKAQYLNYEGVRAMFEAFVTNRYSATGIIQWMYNSAWPKLWWQLFDYYLMPNGAFYGTKKACEPLHLIYNYGKKNVILANLSNKEFSELKAKVTLYNFDLKKVFSKEFDLSIAQDENKLVCELNDLKGLTTTYFIDLRLADKKNESISNNFYCLSTKEDVLDYTKHEWYVTPTKEHGDLTLLNSLPATKVIAKDSYSAKDGKINFTIEVENVSSNLAFLINLNLKDKNSGNSILPIFLDDNYFSLLPNEKRLITGWFYNKEQKPALEVSGWNIK